MPRPRRESVMDTNFGERSLKRKTNRPPTFLVDDFCDSLGPSATAGQIAIDGVCGPQTIDIFVAYANSLNFVGGRAHPPSRARHRTSLARYSSSFLAATFPRRPSNVFPRS